MLETSQVNELLGIKESYKASDRLMEILFNKEEREKLFKAFLKLETDMSYDWFHVYFQDEHADRALKKQDFTPNSISDLLSRIVGEGAGTRMDVAAGTGGLTIKKWHHDRLATSVFDYRPSKFYYHVEELSDRALPFLLFNLLIRGINATVAHGDVLERKFEQVYFIQNDTDDFLGFSNLNVLPRSEDVTREFSVKEWVGEAIKHIESENYLEEAE